MVSKISSMVFTQYLTNILDSVQDAIILTSVEPNDKYRVLMTNAAFHQETGIRKTCIGKTIDQILNSASFEKIVRRYNKVRDTKKSVEYEEWYDLPAGRQIYHVKLIPIFNAVGECVQIAAITRNITDLHQMREMQHEAAETLEQIAYNLRLQ